MTSRKALNNLRQCNACFGVGAAFRDELDAIEKDLDRLDQLKAAFEILKYEIGFDFSEASGGAKAMEVLNGNEYEIALDHVARYCSDMRTIGKARKELTNELDTLKELVDKVEKLENVSNYHFNKMVTFKIALDILKEFFKVSKDINSKTYELHTTFPEYVYIKQHEYEILKEVLNGEC